MTITFDIGTEFKIHLTEFQIFVTKISDTVLKTSDNGTAFKIHVTEFLIPITETSNTITGAIDNSTEFKDNVTEFLIPGTETSDIVTGTIDNVTEFLIPVTEFLIPVTETPDIVTETIDNSTAFKIEEMGFLIAFSTVKLFTARGYRISALKNIFQKTATKKNDQSAVTREWTQCCCKNALQKKIYILKKHILRKRASYKYTKAESCKRKDGK